ncbi:hypothetical protein ACFQDD_00495 [Halorubrum pallidum]|uniref:Uncharacterized protein n=1 Tax=Halorubrum pallidum TaxID=1526114 RepID=A0ABD5SZU9_9EURY
MAPATLTTTEQPAITTESDTGYADVRVDGSVVASVDADTDAPTVRAIDPENPEDAAAEWELAAMDGAVETIVNEPAGYADVVVNEIIVATVRVDDGEVSVRAFSPERPQDVLGECEIPVGAAGEEIDG